MPIFNACKDAQAVYRMLLKAMAHPGTRHSFRPACGAEEDHRLLLQIASCLIDHEVTFALTEQWTGGMGQKIAQRTGSRMTAWHRADFVLVNGGTSHGQAEKARRGSLAFPDKSATIIYCVAGSENNAGVKTSNVRLSGPGIQYPMAPQLEGLKAAEYRLLRDINSAYPLGVDVFVIREDHALMGLPRSTRIEVE